ncbi:MAG TPA: hypothetical protein VKA60_16560, partial [Blastocatellia bacterium]|nr:hypothetical protein [Blastocatellia bacterium]
FALTLSVLASEGSVDSVLGSGAKSGYTFASVGAASTTTVPSYFDTNANPQSTGTFGTGNRYFYSNETFVIWQATDAAITAAAAPPGSRVPSSGIALQ